ncbi:hypothetical protein ABMY26_06840 (plasmid) [Azospirillum sp. HJ39]|uniref:phage head spike fiber domain-containing protein n=1 Tax=Azospirillum sp. HJ39 TaxID=3159496 RepID=UPI003555D48F
MTTTVNANGNAYTDDSDPNTGMGNYGWRKRLLPMLSDVMVDVGAKLLNITGIQTDVTSRQASASTAANTASTAANTATQQAAIAVAAANTAAGIMQSVDVVDRAGIPPIIDFPFSGQAAVPAGVITGSSGKWVWAQNGLLTYVPAGSAPIEYDPATGALRGLVVEGARTNLLLRWSDFTTVWGGAVTVTPDTNVAPDGSVTADTLTATGAGFLSRQQTVTVANDTAIRVASAWFRKTTGATVFPGFQILYAGGVLKVGSGTLNTNTGIFTPRPGEPPAGIGVEDCGAYWRVWVSLANNATGSVNCSVSIYPGASTDGVTWVAGMTGSAVVWGAMLEAGSAPSSAIPTTTAPVTRAADVMTIQLSSIPGWNSAEGTIYVEQQWDDMPQSANIGVDDGSGANVIYLRTGSALGGSPGSADMLVNVAGVEVLDSSGPTLANGVTHRQAMAFGAGSYALCADGGAVTTAAVAMPSGLSRLLLADGSQYLGRRWVKRVVVLPRRRPSPTLQLMTA